MQILAEIALCYKINCFMLRHLAIDTSHGWKAIEMCKNVI